jgi:hypothetical protein
VYVYASRVCFFTICDLYVRYIALTGRCKIAAALGLKYYHNCLLQLVLLVVTIAAAQATVNAH